MRVLFFNYEYPPLGGGAANATAYLLREFSQIPGLQIDLVTSSIDSKYHLKNIGTNIRIHRLPIGKNSRNLHFQSQKDLLIYAWKAFWFSRKLIRENSYDLSHSFFTVPCGFLSLIFHWWYKIPYIVSLRGSDVPGYSERFSLNYKFLTPLIKLIWRQAAQVVANSQGLKDLALQTKTKKEIGIIYNGIDINHFKSASELRHPMSKFIITTGASRVTHRKGLNYLFEAVAQLSTKYPDIRVKIMGDGNAKEDLLNLSRKLNIESKIEFLGRIPREETAPYYQEASVFVLPSLNEGMSNAMLEALGSGLPIIATDTGGSKELLTDNNGYIVKFKDSADIAEKLENLINNPALVKSMGDESHKIAERMSWQKVAEQYLDLYRRI